MYGRVLGRGTMNKIILKLFDKTVWLWKRVDRILPWRGLSLIVVAVKSGGGSTTPQRESRAETELFPASSR